MRKFIKQPITASTQSAGQITLADALSLISSIDQINIQDDNGEVAFDGLCSDFRATSNRRDLLSARVDRLRAYNGIIIILLGPSTISSESFDVDIYDEDGDWERTKTFTDLKTARKWIDQYNYDAVGNAAAVPANFKL